MTFPTIPTVAASRILFTLNTAGGATKTFPNLSSLTKDAGDLLIAIAVTYDGNSTNAEFSSWGGGFTEFKDQATTTTMGIGCAYKWSTGSETGTFTVTTADTSTNDSVMILMSIPGAHASTPPEASNIANGTSTAADPGALDPAGWDAEDTLWIFVGGCGETSTTGSFAGIDAAPTNYSDAAPSGVTADVVGGVEATVAFRQLNASSEDAGASNPDLSNARNSALLIAVRPAAAVPGAVEITPSDPGTTIHLSAVAVSPDPIGAVTLTPAVLKLLPVAPSPLGQPGMATLTPPTLKLVPVAVTPTAPTTGQVAWRLRNDDGTEVAPTTFVTPVGATWKAAQSTQRPHMLTGRRFRVRFEIAETGAVAAQIAPRLQHRLNGGTWTTVTATSSVVQMVASPFVANDVATTNQLTAGGGTFTAGKFNDDDGVIGAYTLAASGNTECEWCIQIVANDVVHGDTIELRSIGLGGGVDPWTNYSAPAQVSFVAANFLSHTFNGGTDEATVTTTGGGGHALDRVIVAANSQMKYDNAVRVALAEAVRVDNTVLNSNTACVQWDLSSFGTLTTETFYFRMAMLWDSLPTGGVDIFRLIEGYDPAQAQPQGTRRGGMMIDQNGAVRLTNNTGTTVDISSGAFVADEGIRIEGQVNLTTEDVELRVWFDDALDGSPNFETLTGNIGGTATSINCVRFGVPGNNASVLVGGLRLDDLGFSFNGWLGPSPALVTLTPATVIVEAVPLDPVGSGGGDGTVDLTPALVQIDAPMLHAYGRVAAWAGHSPAGLTATLYGGYRWDTAVTHGPPMATSHDGNSQYVVWADENRHLRIAKRTRTGGVWGTWGSAFDLSGVASTPFVAPFGLNRDSNPDSHNAPTVAVDANGRIHVAGDMHNHALRYMRSTNAGDITAWTIPSPAMVGTQEAISGSDGCTYPQFVTHPDGTLLFFYRYGFSSNGDTYLNVFNAGTNTWSRVALIFQGKLSPFWSAYPLDYGIDPTSGRIHILWTWRGDPGEASNKDICYAYSDDKGATWRRTDGTTYTLPITQPTSEVLFAYSEFELNILNSGGMCVDAAGRPHGACMIHDGTQYQIHHFWWTGDLDAGVGEWRNDQITNYSAAQSATRPKMAALPNGAVVLLGATAVGSSLGSSTRTVRVWDVTNPDDIVTWEVQNTIAVLSWEPSIDEMSLRLHGEIHVPIHPQRGDGFVTGDPADLNAQTAAPTYIITAAEALALTPATLRLAAVTLDPLGQPGTATLTPAVLTLEAVPVAPLAEPGTVTLTPATVHLAAPAVDPISGPGAVTLTPAVLHLAAPAVDPLGSGPGAATLTPATLRLAAVELAPLGSGQGLVTLTPATLYLSAVPLDIELAPPVQLDVTVGPTRSRAQAVSSETRTRAAATVSDATRARGQIEDADATRVGVLVGATRG